MTIGRFLGAPYPITDDASGLLHTQSGVEQIKSDLLILLLTNPGERCLSGDTKIPLANGEEYTIKELTEMGSFWVYSFDSTLNMILPGKAKAFKTLENSEVMEVTLDNDETVKCTNNHLWLLRNGNYKRTDELKIGESLMPLYRNLNTSKYERLYQPYLKDYRETHLCFVEGKRETGIREVVHHVDLNKRNNSPDNLLWMTREAHVNLHKEISNAFLKKIKDPVFKEIWIQKLKEGLKKYYENHDGPRKGAILTEETKKKLSDNKNKFYESDKGKTLKNHLKEKALNQFATKGHPTKGMVHSEDAKEKMRGERPSMSGDNNPSKRPEVRKKLKLAWVKRREKIKNHKVKEIKKLNIKEDCYDLHVEKYHNFALSAGAFVHNCMLPEFGTDLRSLMFEPNDPILEQKAIDIIARSIRLFEPRVVIDSIVVTSNTDPTRINPIDDQTNLEHILLISIRFFDPDNIQQIEELKLEVPLGGS